MNAFVPRVNDKPLPELFLKFYAQALGTAETKNLVSGYVNRFP